LAASQEGLSSVSKYAARVVSKENRPLCSSQNYLFIYSEVNTRTSDALL
jgi:hypothetical protein